MQIKIYTIIVSILLLISIFVLCGQCGRADNVTKKYNNLKAEYADIKKSNTKLRDQLAIGKTEVERLTGLLSASHKRVVELERVIKIQGTISVELAEYLDGDEYLIGESKKAIERSEQAIGEIEKYYNSKKSVK